MTNATLEVDWSGIANVDTTLQLQNEGQLDLKK